VDKLAFRHQFRRRQRVAFGPMADPTDRDALARAAAKVGHMTELVAYLEMDGSRQTRRRIRARLRRWEVDTSHWSRSPQRWYSDELLADAAASSVSYAEVLRKLGVPLSGGSHHHLARRIRAAGIDTSHFLGQAHRRGMRAPRLHPAQVLRVLEPGAFRIKAPQLRRAMIASGVEERCAECGCDGYWRGAPLRLIVDHIDGNCLDNRLQNLRFLCPNCHSQTATWCRKMSARTTIERPARLAE